MSEWKPIDSAPRAGYFLAWINGGDTPVVAESIGGLICAVKEHHQVSCGSYCYGGSVTENFRSHEATHWAELPEPPK